MKHIRGVPSEGLEDLLQASSPASDGLRHSLSLSILSLRLHIVLRCLPSSGPGLCAQMFPFYEDIGHIGLGTP